MAPPHGREPAPLSNSNRRRRLPRSPSSVSYSSEAEARNVRRRRPRERKRDYGDGGAEGIVLSLELSEDYPYDAVYTVNGKIGGQVLPLQVDTGSADLWVASTSCSSQACSGASLYDPSTSSLPTNKTFTMQYLQGKVSGPVVWDDVSIGSYNIPSQALASASSVSSERLAADTFSGVLGLAPALDSKIAQLIPPVVGNDPDGAAWTSNLYGSDTPPPPFFSLLLERPEDPDTVSTLGIGAHPLRDTPSNFTPSALDWTPVVTSNDGALYWRVPITDISVQINGQSSSLQLGKSNAVPASARPVAVIDSGTPLILAAPQVADAFWGAFGVNPAADGNFYPLCTLMVNATITIGNTVYPLHPLDMSVPASNDPTSTNCVGGLQSVTGQTAGDIILGAAFLKNVYSVYTANASIYSPSSTLYPNPNIPPPEPDLPHVGLYPLTNAQQAAEAFRTVRINNQAITPTTTASPSAGAGQLNIPSVNTSSNLKIPLPVVIILAVVGFIALVVSLYLLRGCLYRRRRERELAAAAAAGAGGEGDESFTFSNGKPVPGSGEYGGYDEALLFMGALKKRSFRSMSDGTTGTGGTEGTEGTATTGQTGAGGEAELGRIASRTTGAPGVGEGSDRSTPLTELPESYLSLVPTLAHSGGRYPSPVRTSRVEIPMPVRRESASYPSPSADGSGMSREEREEREERERFRSGLRRGLQALSIPITFAAPAAATAAGGGAQRGSQSGSGRDRGRGSSLSGEPLIPDLDSPVQEVQVHVPVSLPSEPALSHDHEHEDGRDGAQGLAVQEREGEEGEPKSSGPLLGRFSAALWDAPAGQQTEAQHRLPTIPASPRRKPVPDSASDDDES